MRGHSLYEELPTDASPSRGGAPAMVAGSKGEHEINGGHGDDGECLRVSRIGAGGGEMSLWETLVDGGIMVRCAAHRRRRLPLHSAELALRCLPVRAAWCRPVLCLPLLPTGLHPALPPGRPGPRRGLWERPSAGCTWTRRAGLPWWRSTRWVGARARGCSVAGRRQGGLSSMRAAWRRMVHAPTGLPPRCPAPRSPRCPQHQLVRELGVRYRDLLTLDPTVPIPFPAAILIRPKARF